MGLENEINYMQVLGGPQLTYPPIFHNGDVCVFCGGKGKRIDPTCPPVMGYVGPNGEGFPEIHCNPCGGTGVRSLPFASTITSITVNPTVMEQPLVINDEKFEIRHNKNTGHYMVQFSRVNDGKLEMHTKECGSLDEIMKFISSKT